LRKCGNPASTNQLASQLRAWLMKTRRWVQWSPVELVRLFPCRPGLDMWPIFAFYILLLFSLVPPCFGYVTPHLYSWFYTCLLCYSHDTHTPTFCILYFIRTCMHTNTHSLSLTHTHTHTHTQRNSPYQGCPRCGRRPPL
jgi:hypothetical protein